MITAQKKKKSILFSLKGHSSKEPPNCNYILQMFSMYLVKNRSQSKNLILEEEKQLTNFLILHQLL